MPFLCCVSESYKKKVVRGETRAAYTMKELFPTIAAVLSVFATNHLSFYSFLINIWFSYHWSLQSFVFFNIWRNYTMKKSLDLWCNPIWFLVASWIISNFLTSFFWLLFTRVHKSFRCLLQHEGVFFPS